MMHKMDAQQNDIIVSILDQVFYFGYSSENDIM